MASQLSWLRTCKLKQLEAIARATGVNSSGTKPILITNIQDALTSKQTATSSPTPKRNHDYNILSIDMGIRNLAYCHLSLPSTWLSTSKTKKTNPQTINPIIKHWARIDVSKSTNSNEAVSDEQTKPTPIKESFDPSTYAAHAHHLLTHTLLPLAPTHILIERQRFRSMGGSSVQEWTLRVNMFEAMLYATLHTLRQAGKWEGNVLPVEPNKVSKFWIGGEEGGRGKGKKAKKRKMARARELVGVGTEVVVEEMGEGWLADVAEKGKGKAGKFDDLADSLLQGLAWVRWEENRTLVWDKGVDVLEEFMEKRGDR
ncbi:MAG: hypothetical protein Q9184_005430 [Pyrenodesmia sp. 2 TL-2023]